MLEYFTLSTPIILRVAIGSYDGILNNVGEEGLIVTHLDLNDTEFIPTDVDSSTQLFTLELGLAGSRTSGNYIVGKYDGSSVVVCCCLSCIPFYRISW